MKMTLNYPFHLLTTCTTNYHLRKMKLFAFKGSLKPSEAHVTHVATKRVVKISILKKNKYFNNLDVRTLQLFYFADNQITQ